MEPLLNETRKTDTPPRGPSLLDLPDELITLIFRFVYLLERDEKRTGTAIPLDRIRVNKRTFSLAYPMFLQVIRFPNFGAYRSATDAFFGGMVRQSRYWQHVKRVEIQDVSNNPALTSGTLASLRDLRSLSIVTSDPIPAELTSAIIKLEHLSDLTMTGTSTLQDGDFDLRESSIRRLEGSSGSLIQQMLRYGRGGSLEELVLHCAGLSNYEIPWQSLRVLRLQGDSHRGVHSHVPGSLQSLENAISRETPLPLVTFDLSMHDSSAVGTQAYAEGQARRVELLSAVLRLSEATQLKLSRLSSCPLFNTLEVFPCDNLEALHSLLSRFSSLTHLTLISLPFHEEHTSLIADHSTRSFAILGLRYPAFAAFLTYVRTTPILTVQYEPDTETLKMLCTRTDRDAEFAVEVVKVLRR
ncbi:hypothetical protein JCM10450v2_005720 [Rhodotorula kratochvilovae]